MLIAAISQYFFGFTIFISSLFLILLVLVQRGRGGGLTGALGGPGGQSAFGTKAGDLFTRITVGVAAVWIFLCAAAVFFLKDRQLPQMMPSTPPAAVMGSGDGVGGAGSGLNGESTGAGSGLDLSPLNLPSGVDAEATDAPAGSNPSSGSNADAAGDTTSGSSPAPGDPATTSDETQQEPSGEPAADDTTPSPDSQN